uniref:F-box domain-containing protein n=1 Tax=Mycena chlorophos TaxID=658473 RepID=A0ABQ0LCN1_MYCCL|nr:predicted protein [Mycena chlorophos]
MTASPPALPPELITTIVDELRDDYNSLAACALVDSDFCAAAQPHFFRAIWVHRANLRFYDIGQRGLHRGVYMPSGTFRAVAKIFARSRHLAGYVKDLSLDLPDSTNEDVPLTEIVNATSSNLERLLISGLGVEWTQLSSPLKDAILGAIGNRTQRKLHLLNLRNLPAKEVYSAMQRVEVLSIHSSTFAFPVPIEDEFPDFLPPQITPPNSSIRHLILSNGFDDTFTLLLSPDAPVLCNVSKLYLHARGFTHAQRLLNKISNTLEDLTLDCADFRHPFTLQELPNLQSLTLRMSRGIARNLPSGLPDTLLNLTLTPRTSLTLLFELQSRVSEPPWDLSFSTSVANINFGLGTGLVGSVDLLRTRFQLSFQDPFPSLSPNVGVGASAPALDHPRKMAYWQERAFEEFGVGMRRIFGGDSSHDTAPSSSNEDDAADVSGEAPIRLAKVKVEWIQEGTYVARLP